MRRVKEEFKHLDFAFENEKNIADPKWLAVIVASYDKAHIENPLAADLARRRYRRHEHRLKTCRQLFISEAQYYKLLSLFLRIAKAEEEKFS